MNRNHSFGFFFFKIGIHDRVILVFHINTGKGIVLDFYCHPCFRSFLVPFCTTKRYRAFPTTVENTQYFQILLVAKSPGGNGMFLFYFSFLLNYTHNIE